MAISYKLTINKPAANKIAVDYAFRLVTGTTRRTFNRANVLTPVDTGRLRAGNTMRVRRFALKVRGEIFNLTKYAPPVHFGSKAHTIRPKRKKALKFEYHGATVFARSVHMPARTGRPWLTRALREVAGAEGYKLNI